MENSSDATPRGRGQAPIGLLLEAVLANLDLRSRLRERLALLAWPDIAGQVVSSHARAEAVRDGVLLLAADSPAWAQELQMRRQDLLARIAQHLGPGVIRDLHFRSGPAARARRKAPRLPRPADIKLSGRQHKQIAAAAARIDDPALRARVERAFTALMRMSLWRKETGWRQCGRCGQWQRVGRRWCSSCAHSARPRRRA